MVVVIIVLGILTTVLLYSLKNDNSVSEITKLNSDIDNLTDKVLAFYSKYNRIPILDGVTGLNDQIPDNWKALGKNDIGDFAVIDLSAIEGLTLNFGRDFENVKTNKSIQSKDIYIINKNSHNIFYLNGIKVDGNSIYTNKSIDTEKVDVRYVDGIKIFDTYSYKSGNKTDGIIISNNQSEYKWIDLENAKYTLSSDGGTLQVANSNSITIIFTGTQNASELLESANQYKGFYLKENDAGYVLYFSPENEKWSKVYDVESMYRDQNGEIAYIPAGFQVSKLAKQDVIDNGLVIQNATTNEKYVWIPVNVPNNGLKNANTTEEIETKLKEYVASFQSTGYTDTWYDGCGINSSSDYNGLKEAMYNSIKNKGGFWILAVQVNSNITCSAAQGEATGKVNGKNTSLLFGIQWDLVCEFITENTSDGDASKLNIQNFGTEKAEWTLEDAPNSINTTPGDNNSVARGGNNDKTLRTPYNYNTTNTNIVYRIAMY